MAFVSSVAGRVRARVPVWVPAVAGLRGAGGRLPGGRKTLALDLEMGVDRLERVFSAVKGFVAE